MTENYAEGGELIDPAQRVAGGGITCFHVARRLSGYLGIDVLLLG